MGKKMSESDIGKIADLEPNAVPEGEWVDVPENPIEMVKVVHGGIPGGEGFRIFAKDGSRVDHLLRIERAKIDISGNDFPRLYLTICQPETEVEAGLYIRDIIKFLESISGESLVLMRRVKKDGT